MKSIIDKLIEGMKEFNIAAKSDIENKNIGENQIAIMSRNYTVILEKIEKSAKEPKDLEVESKGSEEIVLEKGKKLTITGKVKNAEKNFTTITCSKGSIDLYLPIKGISVGDTVTLIFRIE